MIASGHSGWEDKPPQQTVQMVTKENMFKRDYKLSDKVGYNIS
jgi:hypothetical protein